MPTHVVKEVRPIPPFLLLACLPLLLIGYPPVDGWGYPFSRVPLQGRYVQSVGTRCCLD